MRQNEREAILQVQRALRTLGYGVPIDGVWDSATRDATAAFQRGAGLAVSGVVDRATWDALMGEAAAEAVRSISPFPRDVPGFALRLGDESELVSVLHHMLRALAVEHDALEGIGGGMVYTPATARAVQAVQGAEGLAQTGEVDRATWNALARGYDGVVWKPQ